MKYRKNSKLALSRVTAIIVVVIIIVAAIAVFYVLVKPPSSVTTTTSTKPPTITTPLNITNATDLMKIVGLTSAPSKSVTITVWNSYSTSENEAFNKTLIAFEREFPWIHVDVTYGVGVGCSNFETAAKAHDAPIVYRDTSNSGGALFCAGLLLNLSDYLPPQVFSLYLNCSISDWSIGKAVYGLPDDINYILMFYNKQYIPYAPNTTCEMVKIAEQVNTTDHVWGIAYGASDEYGYRFAAWFAGYGGHIFTTQNGQVVPALNSTAMADALNFWYNLTYDLHVNYLAPSTGAGGAEGELFEAGKAAIIFDGPWDLGAYLQALGSNLGAAPLPVISQTGMRAEPFLGATGWMISNPSVSGACSLQIKAALIFILFVTNCQSTYRLWNVAHDIPANKVAYNEAMAELKAGKLSPSYLNQIMEGVLEQAQYTQKFPNIPQMAYYWDSFHIGASEFFAQQINAQTATQTMESNFISCLKKNGFLSSSFEILPLPPAFLDAVLLLLSVFMIPEIKYKVKAL
ncbi:extracellular solute-binding protein [Acidianus sp. HS-5]|uniref:extracellular solute-binding protein n=1 Tax=Acidianus sp. HS-5 TaxID=2886040 RepID=UPI001F218EA3|nr:extracellular solute-binding protein [Acidianus sp. HS-5]BDC18681.1 sugar ABC transporter substrate-binding protein [Acidianus sp. HS-5]